MKVVLFCGGQGMRMRDYSDTMPKPMVPLGNRPILWHIMKYYANYGHRDFILCLGYKGGDIKEYFLEYNECVSNDFVLSDGGRKIELLREDIEDWRITFVDTGVSANVGERLMAVAPFLRDEEMFLANYSDGLTDYPLPRIIEDFKAGRNIGAFLAVRPNCSFHQVAWDGDGIVSGIYDMIDRDLWINGGYFVFRREIFEHMRPGEDLVLEPFRRLMERHKLKAYPYAGFWRCVDTFADLRALETYLTHGNPPWEVWLSSAAKPEDRRPAMARAVLPRRESVRHRRRMPKLVNG